MSAVVGNIINALLSGEADRGQVSSRSVLLHLRVLWLLLLISSRYSSHTGSQRVSAPLRGRRVHSTDTSPVSGTTHPLKALS